MKNIPLQLEARLIAYCVRHMSKGALQKWGQLYADIRELFKQNNYELTDLVPVSIPSQLLLDLHNELGYREERLTAEIHRTLKNSLSAQLQSLAEAATQVVTPIVQQYQIELQEYNAQNSLYEQYLIDLVNWQEGDEPLTEVNQPSPITPLEERSGYLENMSLLESIQFVASTIEARTAAIDAVIQSEIQEGINLLN